MKHAHLLLPLALLASCTQWQLGECLRAPYATYTGLDIERPADGKVWHRPADSLQLPDTCYVLAPEKRYNKDLPLFRDASGLWPSPREEACNLRPTGRVVPVLLRRDDKGNYVYERSLQALPKGLRADDADISPLLAQAREHARQEGNKQFPLPAEHGGSAEPQLSQPGSGRRILIGCCDYVADPLLTLASWPVEWAANIIALPFSITHTLLIDE